MTLEQKSAASLAELAELADRACRDALESGAAVDLVVENTSARDARKLALSARPGLSAGVRVQTYDEWVDALWGLHGDGRQIVTPLQRRILLRPLVAESGLLSGEPSARFVDELAEFAADAIASAVGLADVAAPHDDATLQKLAALVGAYVQALEEHHLVEQAQAEALVIRGQAELAEAQASQAPGAGGASAAARAVVFEGVDLAAPHRVGFVTALAEYLPVTCIDRRLVAGSAPDTADELAALRARLYTGEGGLAPTGALLVGEARGAHAADATTCALVRRMLDAGAAPGQVAVVLPRVADSWPHLQRALARAGIPFAARFSLPAARTPLGSAFCELMRVKAAPGSDDSYAPLADFVATPYAGISGRDARALQMRWRERAGSTPAERMADIAEGFVQGNATATKTRERLAPLAELLDPALGPAACIRLMRAHAVARARAATGAQPVPSGSAEPAPAVLADALADDGAVAQALLDHLAACEQLGCEPLPDELAACSVALERGFAPAPGATAPEAAEPPFLADAVLLTDAAGLARAAGRLLVVPELDARHYPMARQPGPFDPVRERLGIAVADDTVLRQRIFLQDLVELAAPPATPAALASSSSVAAPAPAPRIAFARATHDAEASELVQSALWDELMTAYRTPQDDAADTPIQGIPAALAPHAVRLSEAELFARAASPAASPAAASPAAGPAPGFATRPVVRGRLASPDDVALLTHDLAGKETPFSPTGLEDYYRCPYRWFACRRVGYNGMDAEFDAAAQGNLAHAILERFYRALQAQGQPRVMPENLPAALELLSRSLDEQVAHDEQRSRGGIFLRTERDRYEVEEIRSMLASLVRRDAVFLPGFAPAYFELTLGKGTGTMLEYAGVPVRGKVDRIDVDAQGNAVVIDYKLAGLYAGYGLDPKLDVPGRIQTDIYARLVQRHFDLLGVPLRVVGSVYRSYSRNSLRGAYARGIDWGPEESVQENKDALPRQDHAEDYDAYLDLVERTVAACMERLHAGHIEPGPLNGDVRAVCEYCKALPFCPRGEK